MIPAKADPEKQADYLQNEIEPRLAEAKAGNRGYSNRRSRSNSLENRK